MSRALVPILVVLLICLSACGAGGGTAPPSVPGSLASSPSAPTAYLAPSGQAVEEEHLVAGAGIVISVPNGWAVYDASTLSDPSAFAAAQQRDPAHAEFISHLRDIILGSASPSALTRVFAPIASDDPFALRATSFDVEWLPTRLTATSLPSMGVKYKAFLDGAAGGHDTVAQEVSLAIGESIRFRTLKDGGLTTITYLVAGPSGNYTIVFLTFEPDPTAMVGQFDQVVRSARPAP